MKPKPVAAKPARTAPAPAAPQAPQDPREGGRYQRLPDGSLRRIDPTPATDPTPAESE